MILWEIFVKGGYVMYPLAVCLVIVIALTVERALFFVQVIAPKSWLDRVQHHLKSGDIETALSVVKGRTGPIPNILEQGLSRMREYELHHGWRITDFERFMTEAIIKEAPELSRNTGWLGILATVSPMLGMFGTVTGLYAMFTALEAAGRPELASISGGIREALITTIFGLFVGIIAFVSSQHFHLRGHAILTEMQRISVNMANAIMGTRVSGDDRPGQVIVE